MHRASWAWNPLENLERASVNFVEPTRKPRKESTLERDKSLKKANDSNTRNTHLREVSPRSLAHRWIPRVFGGILQCEAEGSWECIIFEAKGPVWSMFFSRLRRFIHLSRCNRKLFWLSKNVNVSFFGVFPFFWESYSNSENDSETHVHRISKHVSRIQSTEWETRLFGVARGARATDSKIVQVEGDAVIRRSFPQKTRNLSHVSQCDHSPKISDCHLEMTLRIVSDRFTKQLNLRVAMTLEGPWEI